MLAGDDPLIGSVSPEQTLNGETSATIRAEDVTTTGSIDKVWAVITPPGFSGGDPSYPIFDLPTVELSRVAGDRYEGTYDNFMYNGTYEISIQAMDAEGNISMPKGTRVLQEQGALADIINLTPGWNLISLNKQPEDTNISKVLESIAGQYVSVWAYIDGSWKVYDPNNPGFSDLTIMEAGGGYWINMTAYATLSVTGSGPLTSCSLTKDWNLVGYNSSTSQGVADALASIAGKYVSVWAYMNGNWKVYDPNNPGFSDLTTMEPGYGYWINATESCTWTLP
jgi:hypothetical protein